MGSEEEEEKHDVVIVGGGIVGLATALALHRKGISSLVLEKSESLRATGAAIGVFINGWRALDQLGVGAVLRTKAIPILEMQNAFVSRNKMQVVPCRNEGLRCLKRSDLIEALANELPAQSIRFGSQVVAIGSDPLTSFPVIHFDDGAIIKAKVLIGCDGSNSVVARSIGLEAPNLFPRFSVRGFTNYPNGHNRGNYFYRLRENQIICGRTPVDDKLVYWFMSWPGPHADSEVGRVPERIRDLTLDLLKDFPTDIIEMVRHCDLDSLSLTRIRYRAPWSYLSNNFYTNTTTVAGDAMHAMGPFIGQGGSCGLEDAIVLARCLARAMESEIEDQEFKKRVEFALKEYVKARRLRVMRLSIQSLLVGFMLVSSSWTKRLVCIVILMAFFGGMSFSHARYDCGPL